MNSIGFLNVLQSLDSLFPIGTFTMSNGMETYTQKDLVNDKSTLLQYSDSYIYTLPYNDLEFCAKAIQDEDFKTLDLIYSASRIPYELRNGSIKLCNRFLKLENSLGNYIHLKEYAKSIQIGECLGSYSISVGLFIKDNNMDIKQGLEMYCYSLISSMVNHAVKLVPLSQLDGQYCLNKTLKKISKAVEKSLNIPLQDLGISGMGFDFRSMEHEKLYSRLYIS